MGIKHFFIWMKKNHPTCLKDINIQQENFETEQIEINKNKIFFFDLINE